MGFTLKDCWIEVLGLDDEGDGGEFTIPLYVTTSDFHLIIPTGENVKYYRGFIDSRVYKIDNTTFDSIKVPL
jgi:hypothetical protein